MTKTTTQEFITSAACIVRAIDALYDGRNRATDAGKICCDYEPELREHLYRALKAWNECLDADSTPPELAIELCPCPGLCDFRTCEIYTSAGMCTPCAAAVESERLRSEAERLEDEEFSRVDAAYAEAGL